MIETIPCRMLEPMDFSPSHAARKSPRRSAATVFKIPAITPKVDFTSPPNAASIGPTIDLMSGQLVRKKLTIDTTIDPMLVPIERKVGSRLALNHAHTACAAACIFGQLATKKSVTPRIAAVRPGSTAAANGATAATAPWLRSSKARLAFSICPGVVSPNAFADPPT